MMEYFATLSQSERDMAMDIKANELLDNWLDEHIQENGDDLPNLVEEELLHLLDTNTGTTLIELAKAFYAELEEEQNSVC